MKNRLLNVIILISLVFGLSAMTAYAKDGPDPVASPSPQEHEDPVPSVMTVPNALSTGAVSEKLEISSTMPGWQTTSVSAQVGDEIFFEYAGGKWTVDHNLFGKVGPNGYSRKDDQKIYQGCKIDPAYTYGVVLARVGDGPYRLVPLRGTIKATSTGNVAFHINDIDGCLGDNEGSITYTVTNNTLSKAGGQWISPASHFTASGESLTLAARVWAKPGGPAISYVKFTAFFGYRWYEIKNVTPTPGSQNFEYTWDNNSPIKLSNVPDGALRLSFDVYFANGAKAMRPDGYRDGFIKRPMPSPQSLIQWPFDVSGSSGQWAIINGYRGYVDHALDGSPNNYALFALDFAKCPSGQINHATEQCDQANSNWARTTGSELLSPVTGKIAWVDSKCHVISIDIAGAKGYRLVLGHVDPKTGTSFRVGDSVRQGDLIGSVSDGACFGVGDHLHMALYRYPTTQNDLPFNRAAVPFTGDWKISGCNYPEHGTNSEYLGALVPCGAN